MGDATPGSANQRRKVIIVLLILWLTLGQIATYIWKDSIVWVQVQSDLAIVISLAAWYGAETPVEKEN